MKSLTQATLLLRSTTHSSPSSPYFVLSYSNTTQRRLFRASSSSSSLYKDEEEVNRNAKVSVWWDLGNCPIPNGVNPLKISQNITSTIRANGIKGPITITAFGNFNIKQNPNSDFKQISCSVQEELSLTGVSLKHIPLGGESTSDRSLLVDLAFWASQNPPPAHLFLISGDKDFAYILHRLKMNDYNILLASKDPAPGILSSVASITWPWCQLASGGNFINEPPDGSSESCYSHKEKLLEDSVPDMGPPTCMQAESSPDAVVDSRPHAVPSATTNQTGEVSQSNLVQAYAPQYTNGGSKLRAVPRSTKNRICEVLNSYPEGVDSSVLRVELLKRKILSKDLYGYKKFSLFLRSLGSILKLESTDSRIFVHGIKQKVAEPVGLPEPFEVSPQAHVARPLGLSNDTKLADSKLTPAADSEAKNVDKSRNIHEVVNDREDVTTTDVNKKSSVTAYSLGKVDPSPVLPEENVVHSTEGHLSPMGQNDLSTDGGVFRRMWRTVFGHNSDASNTESNHLTEICSTGDNFDKEKPEEKKVSGPFSSSSLYESVSNGEVARKCVVKTKPSQRVGMIRKIVDCCRFWKTSTSPDSKRGNFGEEETQVTDGSGSNKLFSDIAFWEELLSFLHTKKGASLISQSMTREQMAQQLQKVGPSHLNTLALADINHLVDLLISEKKWIEESISKIFPFKLIHSGPASSSSPCSSNDLSSKAIGDSSQSNLQRENVEGKDAPTEACSDNSNKKPCGKSKSEILEDCQKLVTELFKEQPEGFNISTFRPSFRRRYGYDLDYQKLGYQKLAAMLQTFPGVDIGFEFVLPSNMSSKVVIPYSVENDHTEKLRNPDAQLSNSSWEGNDNDDSMFLELGPLSETSKRNPSRPGINRGANEDVHSGSDDISDFSDLEGETPMKDGFDRKSSGQTTDGECYKTVLDSLDLWHYKGDICNEDRLKNRSEVVGYPRIDLKPSSGIGFGQKKHRKTISFVSDEGEDSKGKLLNGILNTLEKPSESRLQR